MDKITAEENHAEQITGRKNQRVKTGKIKSRFNGEHTFCFRIQIHGRHIGRHHIIGTQTNKNNDYRDESHIFSFTALGCFYITKFQDR